MLLGLQFRERLRGLLGVTVAQELDQLCATIQTSWNTQHKDDDTHGDVTADSLQTVGLCRAGRLSVGNPLDLVLTADVTTVWEPANIATAGHLRVTGAFTVYGLSVRGRQVGDVLPLANANQSVDSIGLRLQASALSGQDGQFKGDGSVPDTLITIPPGRFVWLLCDRNSAVGARLFWRVSYF